MSLLIRLLSRGLAHELEPLVLLAFLDRWSFSVILVQHLGHEVLARLRNPSPLLVREVGVTVHHVVEDLLVVLAVEGRVPA